MHLPRNDIDLFFKLWLRLLSYTSELYPAILDGPKRPEEIAGISCQKLVPLRNRVYQDSHLVEDFVKANPFHFTIEELDIVSGWRHFVKGQFIIIRPLKSYTVFLGPEQQPVPYGVLALNTPFESMIDLPGMAEVALLPFKDHIISDGILIHSNATFGPGMRASFNAEYNRAKSMYGIVTTLPFTPQKPGQSDEDLLRFYLKNEQNREEYRDEIGALLKQNPSLLPVYHQEYGKLSARTFKRHFQKHELARAWFAVLDNEIIASGKTQKNVTDTVAWLVPQPERDHVYVFEWKP